MSDLGPTIRAALLKAVREEFGDEPIPRPKLVLYFQSLRRVLEKASSPDCNIVSDMKYRAVLSAQADELFAELYDKGRG